ncbi:MAG TPA: ABC transporter ATP-binding protein [Helicobacteraceae bacterium]|nr:ABC transporter ATP-binding protein [Helicobacteraceae bacterium]
MLMIEVHGLNKSFNGVVSVSDVDLDVKKGEIYGLLGPNAAGKTTTIRMMCGVVTPDSGSVLINGVGIDKAKQNFGYVAQYFGQYEELSVYENLKFYAQMYGVEDTQRLEYLLKRYQLSDFRDKKAGALSGGYQRRLALVCALSHDPDVLFLDEPTAGIDPVTRKMLWDDFYDLSAEGKTLFITTHYMEEAERCHQLAFIAQGIIIAKGTPLSIKSALGDVHVYSVEKNYTPQMTQALNTLEGVVLLNQFGTQMHIVTTPEVEPARLEALMLETDGQEVTLQRSEPNLEDVFIALTQGGAA